jgi:hypothetical protein
MGDVAVKRISEAGMDEAVARLSKDHDDLEADRRDGYEAGRLWFLSHASYGAVRRIVDRVKEKGVMSSETFAMDPAKEIGFGFDRIRNSVRVSADHWRCGFLLAVVDLWGEVGDEIERGNPIEEPWAD